MSLGLNEETSFYGLNAMSARSAAYVIGHKSLDADHETIIALWRMLEASRTIESARRAACQLMDETIGHFAREEDFMRRCGYPRLDEHHAVHQDLASTLRRVILTPVPGGGSHTDFVTAVCALLGRLVTHIVAEDAKIAPYARNLASQMARTMTRSGGG